MNEKSKEIIDKLLQAGIIKVAQNAPRRSCQVLVLHKEHGFLVMWYDHESKKVSGPFRGENTKNVALNHETIKDWWLLNPAEYGLADKAQIDCLTNKEYRLLGILVIDIQIGSYCPVVLPGKIWICAECENMHGHPYCFNVSVFGLKYKNRKWTSVKGAWIDITI